MPHYNLERLPRSHCLLVTSFLLGILRKHIPSVLRKRTKEIHAQVTTCHALQELRAGLSAFEAVLSTYSTLSNSEEMGNRKSILHLDVKHRVCSKGNRNHAFLINLLLNQWSVLDKVLDVQEAFLKEPNGTLKLVFDLRRGAHFFPHDPIPKLCDFQNLIYKQNFIALRIFPLTPTQRWLTCILHYHFYFSHYLSVYLFCQCSFQ